MSEFNEGDLVEAVKGDTVIRGRLGRVPDGGSRPVLDLTIAFRSDVLHLEANGYTVTVIERAKPELPTERGFYLSCNGLDVLYQGTDGSWSDDAKYGVEPVEVSRKHAPLTRLEPVPETAKKVLDRLSSFWEFGPPQNFLDEFAAIAAEFGVTEGLGE